jgi:hypothetical protein
MQENKTIDKTASIFMQVTHTLAGLQEIIKMLIILFTTTRKIQASSGY